jgi:hypothetical protein
VKLIGLQAILQLYGNQFFGNERTARNIEICVEKFAASLAKNFVLAKK